jgi:hypothetical protein
LGFLLLGTGLEVRRAQIVLGIAGSAYGQKVLALRRDLPKPHSLQTGDAQYPRELYRAHKLTVHER